MTSAPELVDLRTLDDAGRRHVHRHLLAPAFPAAELVPEADFVAENGPGGTGYGWVARLDGTDVGVAQIDTTPDAGAALLAYLAVDPGVRSGGIGRLLLDKAVDATDGMLVAEVEDPAHHHDRGFGDPRRRVRFYARAGGRVIDVPYFQPALTPGGERVPHMLLVLLGTPSASAQVPAAPLRDLVSAYLQAGEGSVDDPQARALLEALAGSTLELRPLPD